MYMRSAVHVRIWLLIFSLVAGFSCAGNAGAQVEPGANAGPGVQTGTPSPVAALAACDPANVFYGNYPAAAWGYPSAESQIANGGVYPDNDGVISVAWAYCGLVIEKRNYDGTLIWQKMHSYPRSPMIRLSKTNWRSQSGFRTIKSPTGYVSVAIIQSYESYFPAYHNADRAMIAVFSFNIAGELLWKRDFDDYPFLLHAMHTKLPPIAIDTAGGVYVGVAGVDYATASKNNGLFSVFKMTANGAHCWQYTNSTYRNIINYYRQPQYGKMYVSRIFVQEDGNILAIGQISVLDNNASNGVGSRLFAAKLKSHYQYETQVIAENPGELAGENLKILDVSISHSGAVWILGDGIPVYQQAFGQNATVGGFVYLMGSGSPYSHAVDLVYAGGQAVINSTPDQLFVQEIPRTIVNPRSSSGGGCAEDYPLFGTGQPLVTTLMDYEIRMFGGYSRENPAVTGNWSAQNYAAKLTLTLSGLTPVYSVTTDQTIVYASATQMSDLIVTPFPDGSFYFSGYRMTLIGSAWHPVSFVRKFSDL